MSELTALDFFEPEEPQDKKEVSALDFFEPETPVDVAEEPDLQSPVTGAFLQAQGTDPELAAKAKKLGMPASMAKTHPNDIRSISEFRDAEWAGIAEKYPELAKLYGTTDAAYTAPDDIGALKKLSDTVTKFWKGEREEPIRASTAASSVAGGVVDTVGAAVRGGGEMLEGLFDVFDINMRRSFGYRWDEFKAKATPTRALPQDAGELAPSGAPMPTPDEILKVLGDTLSEAAKDNFYVADEKSPALYRVGSGAGTLASQVMATAVNPALGVSMLVALGADSQAQALRDADITPEQRALAITAGGSATAVAMMPVVAHMMSKTPDAFKGTIAKWLTDLGQAGLFNAVQTQVDQRAHALITEGVTGKEKNVEIDSQFVVDFITGAFFRGAVRVKEAVDERGRGEEQSLYIDEVLQAARSVKLGGRDSGVFGIYANDIAQDRVTYSERDAVEKVLSQFEPTTEADTLAVERVKEALEKTEEGELVQIPLADLMVLSQSALTDQLSPHMTLDPSVKAPGRRKTRGQDEPQERDEPDVIERMLQRATENALVESDAYKIIQDMLPQLREASRLSNRDTKILSAVLPRWAAAKARRDGKTPLAVMEEAGLLIRGTAADPRQSLAQTAEDSGFRQATAEEFMAAVSAMREADSRGTDVSVRTAEELEGAQLFLADEGRVGFAVMPDGELSSVFKHPDSTRKGAMKDIQKLAEAAGASNLHVFDGPVADLYRNLGWKETGRVEFDDGSAPEGWNFGERGRPDVLTMRLDGRESDGSLAGLPRIRDASAFAVAQQAAKAYMESRGLPYTPPSEYVKADPARGKRIAEEYEKAEHRPNDPEVKAAYAAMIEETNAQYRAILDTGLVVEFIVGEDPYAGTPRMATEDVRNNNHLYVYSTRDGFGTDATFNPAENPLLQETEFTDVNGKPMLANDVFRAVHDYFGHVAEGIGFRADGEENAWRAHSAMYSPLARRAMTTETRGQNSWLNFGPFGEKNRTAKPNETHFADQKTTLLPEWVSEEASGQKLNQRVGVTRGYYSPADRLIALTRAESRTTFMHEMAHFMLDMEPSGGPINRSVREWLSRQGLGDFMKEAERYQAKAEKGSTTSYPAIIRSVAARKGNIWGWSFAKESEWLAKYGESLDIEALPPADKMLDPKRTVSTKLVEALKERGHTVSPKTSEGRVLERLTQEMGGREAAALLTELGYSGIKSDGLTTIWDTSHISEADAVRQMKDVDDFKAYGEARSIAVRTPDARAYLEEGTTGDAALDRMYWTAMHEKFARGFEKFLMEGESPSVEMEATFREASRWASDLYQSLSGADSLMVNLDDGARQLFGSLIATPEQVARAARAAEVEELFTSASMAGMTSAEYQRYLERKDEIVAEAEKTVRSKLAAAIKAQATKAYKQALEAARARIYDELNSHPVHEATRTIREDFPLDTNMVLEIIGESRTRKSDGSEYKAVPSKLIGMGLVKRGGEGFNPDEVAAMLGFDSAHDMLTRIMETPTQKQHAKELAAAEVQAEIGHTLTPEGIDKMIEESVSEEVSEKLLLEQLRILRKSPSTHEREAIRRKAKAKVAALPRSQLKPSVYRAAHDRAAKKAVEALQRGDKEAAAKFKKQQLMFREVEKEVIKAKEEIGDIQTYAKRFTRANTMKALAERGNGFYEQVARLVSDYKLGTPYAINDASSTGMPLPDFARHMLREWGIALDVPQAEANGVRAEDYSVGQLRSVREALETLEHVSKRLHEHLKDGKAQEVQAVVDGLKEQTDHLRKEQILPPDGSTDLTLPSTWAQFKSSVSRFVSEQTKITWMTRWLDGNGGVGAWHQAFIQPFVEARRKAHDLSRVVNMPIITALRERSVKDVQRHQRTYTFTRPDGSTLSMQGHQILHFALHMGSVSGRSKLQEGHRLLREGEDPTMQSALASEIMGVLTKSDWGLINTIWQQTALLFPHLQEQHKRDTGRVLEGIELATITTPHGEMQGGYVPIRKRRDINRSDERVTPEQEANDLFVESDYFANVNVDTSSRVERTKAVYEVELNLNSIGEHVREVIHYATHRDAVVDANILLRNPEVERLVRERLGDEDWQQIRPWLVSVARDGRDMGTRTTIDKIASYLRNGTTIAVMGYKVSTTATQVLGLLNSAHEVGTLNLAKNISLYLSTPSNAIEFVEFATSRSQILASRMKDYDREVLKATMEATKGNRSSLDVMREYAFIPLSYVQLYVVDIPTWKSAYDKEMKRSGDESTAVQYADWVVENVQGSGATMNAAAMFRGNSEVKNLFTMFMTFFSSFFNAQRDLSIRFKDGNLNAFQAASALMLLYVLPVVGEMLLKGRLPDLDDEDEMLAAGVEVAMYPFASVVGVRDLASAPSAAAAMMGERSPVNIQLSPVVNAMGGVYDVATVGTKLAQDRVPKEREVKSAINTLGAWLRLPTGQFVATGNALWQMSEGEDISPREVLIGPNRHK